MVAGAGLALILPAFTAFRKGGLVFFLHPLASTLVTLLRPLAPALIALAVPLMLFDRLLEVEPCTSPWHRVMRLRVYLGAAAAVIPGVLVAIVLVVNVGFILFVTVLFLLLLIKLCE
jgi:hypothetical protein